MLRQRGGSPRVALSFREFNDAVDGRRVEKFCFAVWPAYLDALQMSLCAQAEVEAKIAGRAVAGSAAYLVNP